MADEKKTVQEELPESRNFIHAFIEEAERSAHLPPCRTMAHRPSGFFSAHTQSSPASGPLHLIPSP